MQSVKSLRGRLSSLVLDGGFATHLEAKGYDLNHPLWSAKVLAEDEQAVKAVHADYLNAGADCVISASYQATVDGLKKIGLTEAAAQNLITRSVELAVEVRDQVKPEALVAASVGPYGAAMADGSEYTGYDGSVSYETLMQFHEARWQLLTAGNPDLLACETIPSPLEMKVLSDLAERYQTPFWLCVSCKDGEHLSNGTLITEAFSLVKDNPYLVGWGVNCTAPEYIESLIKGLRSISTEIPVVVYPNSGETYNADTKTWNGDGCADGYQTYAKRWHEAGAGAIGGCCRTTPEHMAAVKQLF